jgi:hypothetical protein
MPRELRNLVRQIRFIGPERRQQVPSSDWDDSDALQPAPRLKLRELKQLRVWTRINLGQPDGQMTCRVTANHLQRLEGASQDPEASRNTNENKVVSGWRNIRSHLTPAFAEDRVPRAIAENCHFDSHATSTAEHVSIVAMCRISLGT